MATTQRISSDLGDRLRGIQRAVGDIAGGGGLWAAIVIFFVWAAVAERDALVIGIVLGAILALGAVGLTLIFGVLKFAHFAHGDSMMVSAFIAWLLLNGIIVGERAGSETTLLPVTVNDLPGADNAIWQFSFGYGLIVAMLLTAVLTAGIMVAIDRVVYRRLRKRKSGIVIFAIASLGLAFVMRSVILIFWGPTPRLYPPGIRNRIDLPFDVSVLADQLFILAAAFVVTAIVYVLLFRTKLGKAMRAMADNPDLARISGIDTDRIITLTWVVAGFLIAVAGVLLALQAHLDSELGFTLLLPLFAAAIVGGLGNPQGALVGGFVVGITQEVAVTFDFLSPGYKFSVAFAILILILAVRPRGLFGERS
ncbi:MAG: branched-chain amino acid ABC transporter permease [Chloroflexi bacterium]|nr:MAG: branched-chain amino acid ABC transporter permease [Chloroflexota bacterium]